MTLSANAILRGFFVVGQVSNVIHTYVNSSCGASWGCHGGVLGGSLACSGQGSSIQADCIEGGDEAGIRYRYTGVCHQIANRILSPASIRIPQIHPDITATYLVFGRYGRGDWPGRFQRCMQGGKGGPAKQPPKTGIGSSSGNGTFMKIGPAMDENQITDISDMFTEGLGHPVNAEKIREFAVIQAEFQNRQMQLAQEAMTDEISHEVYVAELDVAMQLLAKGGERLFGFEDFHKVFGEFRSQNLFEIETPVLNNRQA